VFVYLFLFVKAFVLDGFFFSRFFGSQSSTYIFSSKLIGLDITVWYD